LLAGGAADVVEGEQFVPVLGSFDALTVVEVIGEGLGINDPATMAVEDHGKNGSGGKKKKRGGILWGNPLRAFKCGRCCAGAVAD
jgi:hypothetical protein